jgi:hypothetical protein
MKLFMQVAPKYVTQLRVITVGCYPDGKFCTPMSLIKTARHTWQLQTVQPAMFQPPTCLSQLSTDSTSIT